MEERNESVSDTDQSDQGTQQEPAIDVKFTAEELTERLMATSSEAKKYRQEKALLKQQLEAMNEELSTIKKSTLESQGNYKALYEKLQKDHESSSEKYKTQVGKYALNVIQSSVKEQLMQAQCQRPDAVLKLSADMVRGFELDENFSPNPAEVKQLVEGAQKEYPEWFRKETPKIKDGFPVGKQVEKKANELTKEEIKRQLGVT